MIQDAEEFKSRVTPDDVHRMRVLDELDATTRRTYDRAGFPTPQLIWRTEAAPACLVHFIEHARKGPVTAPHVLLVREVVRLGEARKGPSALEAQVAHLPCTGYPAGPTYLDPLPSSGIPGRWIPTLLQRPPVGLAVLGIVPTAELTTPGEMAPTRLAFVRFIGDPEAPLTDPVGFCETPEDNSVFVTHWMPLPDLP